MLLFDKNKLQEQDKPEEEKTIPLSGSQDDNTQTNYIIEKLVDSSSIPDGYKLENPYPNPFNPILNIDFSIPQNDMVNISIYDITGRLVQELYNDIKDVGYHSIQWNAINYASGIYFIKILTNNFTQTKKVTLLK